MAVELVDNAVLTTADGETNPTITISASAGDVVVLTIASLGTGGGYPTFSGFPSWLSLIGTAERDQSGGVENRHEFRAGVAPSSVTSISWTVTDENTGFPTWAVAASFSGSGTPLVSDGIVNTVTTPLELTLEKSAIVVKTELREYVNNIDLNEDGVLLPGRSTYRDASLALGYEPREAGATGDLFGDDSISGGLSSGSAVALYDNAISGPQDERNRVRSSISEDAGSILDSASLNAVDASFSEAFLLDVSLSSTSTKVFIEALDPSVTAALYYPIPRQSTEFLNDYSGETLLSRMARVYPPPVFDEVSELGLTTFTVFDGDGNDIGTASTAQNVISYIFSEWASDYSWFTYETVPDLRSKVVDPGEVDGGDGKGIAEPSQYSADFTLGRVYTEVIQLLQDDDNRKTMRQILDELLSPFPGTVVRANAAGSLEIVPVYGPDASNTAAVTLTDKDAYTVTKGQPSPKGIVNKWTFTSQPYTATVDGGLLNQSWFQVCSNGFPSGSLYASGAGQDISSDDPYPGGWRPDAWSPQSGRFPVSGTGIKLTDSGGVKQVSIDWIADGGNTGNITGSDLTLKDIPLDGATVEDAIVGIENAIFTADLRVQIAAKYDKESRSVILWPAGTNRFENGLGTKHVFRINLLDATDVWQSETTTVSGTYDLEEETDGNPLPGSPVTSSVAAYGTREKRVDITGWGIDNATLLTNMAKAAVLEAIEPKLIRTVEQSVWRAFPVKWAHMGSVIQLPSGEEGRLTTRTYADDFGSNFGAGSMSSTLKIEVLDSDGSGVIDTTTDYLLLDDGTAFVLDDGTQAEGG